MFEYLIADADNELNKALHLYGLNKDDVAFIVQLIAGQRSVSQTDIQEWKCWHGNLSTHESYLETQILSLFLLNQKPYVRRSEKMSFLYQVKLFI